MYVTLEVDAIKLIEESAENDQSQAQISAENQPDFRLNSIRKFL
jgi:hypothetical protein